MVQIITQNFIFKTLMDNFLHIAIIFKFLLFVLLSIFLVIIFFYLFLFEIKHIRINLLFNFIPYQKSTQLKDYSLLVKLQKHIYNHIFNHFVMDHRNKQNPIFQICFIQF